MAGPRLSFCIPTLNRGSTIEAAIESIAAQADADDEIVIVDGASTDDTPAIVERLQTTSRTPIKYERGDRNRGVDRDLARAVELATRDGCWLFSADDALAPGAIARMRGALEAAGIALCNRVVCARDLKPLRGQEWLPGSPSTTFAIDDDDTLLDYLGRARSIGALFSYISCIAFRRRLWTGGDEALGTNFAHAHRLLVAARAGARLRYVRDELVLCRGDNDSFSSKGPLARFLVDVDGYEAIARLVFQDEPSLRLAFTSVMRTEHPWYMLTSPRSRASGSEWSPIEDRLAAFGYGRAELLAARVLGSQRWLVGAARRVRRAVRMR